MPNSDEHNRLAVSEYYAKTTAPESNDILYAYFHMYKRRVIRRFFAAALEALRAEPRDRVIRILDVGCGDASDLAYALEGQADPEVVIDCIDGSESVLTLAESYFETLPFEASFHQHDLARGIPCPDRSFDVVLCSEVVEHLERPEHLIAEIERTLRPSGFLILTTNNGPTYIGMAKRSLLALVGRNVPPSIAETYRRTGDTHHSVEVVIDGTPTCIYGHINERTTAEWEEACLSAGLELWSYGTYESIRRHASGVSQATAALVLLAGAFVQRLPARWGRHFGDTTALLLRKPNGPGR